MKCRTTTIRRRHVQIPGNLERENHNPYTLIPLRPRIQPENGKSTQADSQTRRPPSFETLRSTSLLEAGNPSQTTRQCASARTASAQSQSPRPARRELTCYKEHRARTPLFSPEESALATRPDA